MNGYHEYLFGTNSYIRLTKIHHVKPWAAQTDTLLIIKATYISTETLLQTFNAVSTDMSIATTNLQWHTLYHSWETLRRKWGTSWIGYIYAIFSPLLGILHQVMWNINININQYSFHSILIQSVGNRCFSFQLVIYSLGVSMINKLFFMLPNYLNNKVT